MEGGRVNGGEGEQQQHALSADMMYKLSKKIAQLTKVLIFLIFCNGWYVLCEKVIYSLNTKNDDLEYDMEAMRVAYEDKLQKVRKEHAST